MNDTTATTCTCPSGDGSLRHPCPTHPLQRAQAQPAAAQEAVSPTDAVCPILARAPAEYTYWEKRVWRRGVQSGAAAPGIDLGQIWERVHADMLARRRRNKHDCFVLRCLKDSVDALAVELIDASLKGGSDAPNVGEVLVTVRGFTGSGKSAVAGEIEILCKALGLDVEWVDSEEEKRLTHADWVSDLELYKPRVRIVERNIPRPPMQPTSAEVGA